MEDFAVRKVELKPSERQRLYDCATLLDDTGKFGHDERFCHVWSPRPPAPFGKFGLKIGVIPLARYPRTMPRALRILQSTQMDLLGSGTSIGKKWI